ncbi:hypothetical protein PILCRDRAFT_816525 [Piloderma croceum F 1598]|uniref:Uncharacterized protein n=1 Tax=Piloderma croceum (strain F 1598) TaxID=765440 RepID=A0A0C3G280_PILCF|nr:hypothetical protein PILCRDRAFT_816525 [Piloderma croceum F 1598]
MFCLQTITESVQIIETDFSLRSPTHTLGCQQPNLGGSSGRRSKGLHLKVLGAIAPWRTSA